MKTFKILVSWLAYEEDFKQGGEAINENGPHFKLYRHHWEALGCDKHIILLSDDNDDLNHRKNKLIHYLKNESRRFEKRPAIESQVIYLNDPWDVAEIFQKTEKFILENMQTEFLAMINTGTRDMQTAWYLLSSKFPKQLELLKVKHPIYSANKEAGDIERGVKLAEGILPSTFTVRGATQNESSDFVDFQPEARKRAKEVALSPDTTVLILGEHGTGKESLAKTIHNNSARKAKPYEIRNCAGYTDEILRSELFGHVKGSFTGATDNKIGLFEQAKGGTVFLDEIGDISPFMQVSLLRVIQNKEIVPVGGSSVKKIDVRIIVATNRDLVDLCKAGKFRWDLYYRLAVAEINTKPVRELALNEKRNIIDHFIDEMHKNKFKDIGKDKIHLSKEAKELLDAYDFPGNIREIENLVESFYTFESSQVLQEMIPFRIKEQQAEQSDLLEAAIRKHVTSVYKKYGQNKAKTQQALGLGSPNTLNKYLYK